MSPGFIYKRKQKLCVLIGVCTYQRNEQLVETITSLAAMAIPADIELTVLISDNSKEKQAENVVLEQAQIINAFDLKYVSAPKQGISYARNKVLDHALQHNFEYIAFIDDDETADQNWIKELISCAVAENADLVNGHVDYIYPESAPEWMMNNKLHRGAQPTIEADGSTNNILYRVDFLRQHALFFDPRYGLSGGEDRHLMRRIKNAGGRRLYCPGAKTREHIHPSRLSQKWLVRRQFRAGYCDASLEKDFEGVVRSLITLGQVTLIGCLKSFFHIARFILTGKKQYKLYAQRHLAHIAGWYVGLSGYYKYDEYGA